MQVIAAPDPLGGIKYTNRENGKSATIQRAIGGWFVFIGASSVWPCILPRREAMTIVETYIN